jgi:lipopolysaccharide/colanic/teichoic acid biosynthesis glycosyltransferase
MQFRTIATAQRRPHPATLALKRCLDVVGAIAGLVLLSPVFLIVAIAIKRGTAGPVFFRQQRVGQDGRLFTMVKFRSMTVDAPRRGSALTLRADKRITRVGRFLRNSKLDELPQLVNVLVGDMSLVGPRPEVPEFMRFYSPEQRATIVSMRPGLTDYAAILFRDESALLDQSGDPIDVYRRLIMPIKFRHYERYSHEIGMMTDLRIILATALLLTIGRAPSWLRIEGELLAPPVLQGDGAAAGT